jgi:hypothetical protein
VTRKRTDLAYELHPMRACSQVRRRTLTGEPPPYGHAASIHPSEAPMWRSMIETFETPDVSTPEALIGVLQVYVGVALIVLGVLLTGVTVERVMSL